MENDLVGYGKCPYCKTGGNLATIMDHARRCFSNPEYKKKWDKQMAQVIKDLKKKKKATLTEAKELLSRALKEIGSTELCQDIRDFLNR